MITETPWGINRCMEIVEHRYNQLVEPEFGMDRAHMIGQLIQERAKKLKKFIDL